MLQRDRGVGDRVAFAVPFRARAELRVLYGHPARAKPRDVDGVALAAVIGVFGIDGEALGQIVARPIGVVELDAAIEVEVQDRTPIAVLAAFVKDIADARRHAVPGVGQAAAAAVKLVEPVETAVVGVELQRTRAFRQARIGRVLHQDVDIRLHRVRPIAEVGPSAQGERHAAFYDGAVDVVVRARRARLGRTIHARGVPERSAIGDPRHDGKNVRNLERERETVIGIHPQGLIVRPGARIVAEGQGRGGGAYLRRLAIQPADARGRFVVQGQAKDGCRIHVEIGFGEARDA